ncbi:GntR family transcriptional regulator [Nesterenkonia suensis]
MAHPPPEESTSDTGFTAPITRGEAVAQRLRHEILSGELPPGAPLRDAELAARLGVSITPVRESVATLMAEGLVEALPNKRRRVAVLTQRQAEELSDLLGMFLTSAVERLPLSPDDVPKPAAPRPAVGEVSAAARRMAEACRSHTRQSAEPAYRIFATTLFRATGHTELIRVAVPALRRTLSMFRQYPVEPLLPTWEEALEEVAHHLDALHAAPNRASAHDARRAASARFRRLTEDLLGIIREADRTPEDPIADSPA